MAFRDKKARQLCYASRDRYWECLDAVPVTGPAAHNSADSAAARSGGGAMLDAGSALANGGTDAAGSSRSGGTAGGTGSGRGGGHYGTGSGGGGHGGTGSGGGGVHQTRYGAHLQAYGGGTDADNANKPCMELRRLCMQSCPEVWVKHFDRKRQYMLFRQKVAAVGNMTSETKQPTNDQKQQKSCRGIETRTSESLANKSHECYPSQETASSCIENSSPATVNLNSAIEKNHFGELQSYQPVGEEQKYVSHETAFSDDGRCNILSQTLENNSSDYPDTYQQPKDDGTQTLYGDRIPTIKFSTEVSPSEQTSSNSFHIYEVPPISDKVSPEIKQISENILANISQNSLITSPRESSIASFSSPSTLQKLLRPRSADITLLLNDAATNEMDRRQKRLSLTDRVLLSLQVPSSPYSSTSSPSLSPSSSPSSSPMPSPSSPESSKMSLTSTAPVRPPPRRHRVYSHAVFRQRLVPTS